jgi:nickel transport system ATP-binding protein
MNFFEVRQLNIINKKTNTLLLNNLSFKINENEILGIVGESGSGKSLICKAILGILPDFLKLEGSIKLNNKEILNTSSNHKNKISIILQEAMNAFDPLYTIGEHMMESLHTKENKKQAKQKCLMHLEDIGLKNVTQIFKSYAHELSGGELQRIMIAIAFSQDSSLIIADEPTSSLDCLNQKQIVDLFKKLKHKKKTLIFVSHDLAIISQLANNVLVMKDGSCMEYTDTKTIFTNPQNDFTAYLLKTRFELSQRFIKCFN